MDIDLQNLINRFKDFSVIENKPSFLDIAHFPHRETVWRNIFAFFFDPNGCHGFKDLFLRSFFDAIGENETGTGDFTSMAVTPECQTPKGNYLDLLIQCNEFVIGIEMKVNAPLYNDLEDYADFVDSKVAPLKKKIVLSKNFCETKFGFTNLFYAEFVCAIKQQLGNYVLAADPKYVHFLLDFLTHITRYIGDYTMTIDPKQLQFMQDNYVAIENLIEADKMIKDNLEQKMLQIYDELTQIFADKLIEEKRCFTFLGKRLSKFSLVVDKIKFYCELGITDDYCVDSKCWIDKTQADYQYLAGDFNVFIKQKFELLKSSTEVVKFLQERIESACKFLSEKQIPAIGK